MSEIEQKNAECDDVTFEEIAKIAGYTDEEKKWAMIFWDSAFNNSWIYLSDEAIVDWMGYKAAKNTNSNFYKEMKKKYTTDIDYKEVTNKHMLIKNYYKTSAEKFLDGNGKKYYIVTGTAFKKMLMRASTKKGEQTCDYFIKTERLAAMMRDHIIKLKNQQLQKYQEDYKRLHDYSQELIRYKKSLTKDETIYIVSSLAYARQGIYKVGRTKNMRSRTSGHNNTRIKADKMIPLATFQVNNSKITEARIHQKLENLRIEGEKEFFLIPFNLLKDVVDLIVNNDDTENERINNVIDTVCKLRIKSLENTEDIWLEGLDINIFNEHRKIIKMISNEEDDSDNVIHKFDVSNATEEQKQNFILGCIEAYARNIPKDDNDKKIILWREFSQFIQSKINICKRLFKTREWRMITQEVTKDSDELAIKYRATR